MRILYVNRIFELRDFLSSIITLNFSKQEMQES